MSPVGAYLCEVGNDCFLVFGIVIEDGINARFYKQTGEPLFACLISEWVRLTPEDLNIIKLQMSPQTQLDIQAFLEGVVA